MLSLAEEAIKIIKSHSIPLIIDGDGICLLERNPELLLGSKSIITPNHNEFARLCSAMDVHDQNLALKFPDSLIIRKGAKDEIFNSHQCNNLLIMDSNYSFRDRKHTKMRWTR